MKYRYREWIISNLQEINILIEDNITILSRDWYNNPYAIIEINNSRIMEALNETIEYIECLKKEEGGNGI